MAAPQQLAVRAEKRRPDRDAALGVKVTVLEDAACIALMHDFIVSRPELWHEDIGE